MPRMLVAGLLLAAVTSACGAAGVVASSDSTARVAVEFGGPPDFDRMPTAGPGGESIPSLPTVAPPPAVSGGEVADAAAIVGEIRVVPASAENLESPAEPARLQLDRLGIDMPVVDVGRNDDGSMELPGSAGIAGWFRLGGNPGGGVRGRQNAVIAAHVDDAVMGRGPFVALHGSRPGDRVTVTLDDGTTRRYVVDRVEQTSKREVDLAAAFGAPDGRLVLVTCGRWDPDVRHYEDNVLVWAAPEEED